MEEPKVGEWNDVGEAVDFLPFSQAPSERLRSRILIGGKNVSGAAHYDDDFRRRYAAILLRERNT